MKVVVAGQSSVGLDLAAKIAARGHETTGYDPDPQRVRELAEGLADQDGKIYGMLGGGSYKLVTTPAGIDAYDVGFVTPDDMILGFPHVSWDRFNMELNSMARGLRSGSVLLMHCVSLNQEAMIRDAEALIRMTYRKTTPENYKLAWTLIEGGEPTDPGTQTVLVGALDTASENAAVEKLETMFGTVRRWSEVAPPKMEALPD